MAGEYRLSLVAQFDDLVRNGKILTQGIETEFLKFATGQHNCMKKWSDVEVECSELRNKVKNLANQNATLETKLKDARGQIDHQIKKRRKVEDERDNAERQMHLAREFLSGKEKVLSEEEREKLHFLSTDFQFSTCYESPKSKPLERIEESCSLLSDCDISYDKTEEDLEESHLRYGRKYYKKRASAPPAEEITPPPKTRKKSNERRSNRRSRHRRSNSTPIVVTSTINVDGEGEVNAEAEIEANGKKKRIKSPRPSIKKYHSSGNIRDGESSDDMYNRRSPQTLIKELNSHLSSPGGPLRRTSSKGSIINRRHVLVSKKIYWSETCWTCGRKIGLGRYAMKCKDCKACAHPEHKDDLPLPCIPANSTPMTKGRSNCLIDHIGSMDPPMIPAIVIHCANEIEHRGLHERYIYRVPGSDREIRELRDRFAKNKGAPYLANVNDIHVICGCLKDFFRNLKEKLIPNDLWHDFVSAAEHPDEEEGRSAMIQAISQLPQPNKDTLAFMMLHLQRVSESPDAEMTPNSLARCLGPSLVGYSSANADPQTMLADTMRSNRVVEQLINISTDYWESLMNILQEDSALPMHRDITSTPQTPERNTCDYESILGPLGTPTHTPTTLANETAKRGWLTTPRIGNRSRQTAGRRGFFESPTLK